jgi:Transcription factor zinc-finger
LVSEAPVCPRCKVALERLGVGAGRAAGCRRCSGVWLDDPAFSPGHGTWFDRNELTSVARAIAQAHAASSKTSELGRMITPQLEAELARSVPRRSLIGALSQDVQNGLWSLLTHRAEFGAADPTVGNRNTGAIPVLVVERTSRAPRELRRPSCTAQLPPEAHGRWVCKYCNATLDV